MEYARVHAWRRKQIAKFEIDPKLVESAKAYYKGNCSAFINHWVDTYDPRNVARKKPAKFPLVMFYRQEELIDFVIACMNAETDGLIEKSRDMGATWVCVGISVWLWLFWDGTAIGWGSRKQELVDRIGDPSSIFEKIRQVLYGMPEVFLPEGFRPKDDMHYMRIVNPENASSIIGEIGDSIGRGGRTLLYFKDESAHYAHPESIQAALNDNTRVQIDLSSVSGLGTVFHRRRQAGEEWQHGSPANPEKTNVFILDWRDHPEKDEKWYKRREAKARSDGLLHLFRQEVDRDYSASVEGVIIPADHAKAAIDAHIKLGIEPSGIHMGALDPADEGLDKNAQTVRRGILALMAEHWDEGDTGDTTRKSVNICRPFIEKGVVFLNQYDGIGVGAGVKAEANRLRKLTEEAEALERGGLGASDILPEEFRMPTGLRFVPWLASGAVQDPFEHVIRGDKDTPLNRDFYQNFKAQAWHQVARRFAITYRAINEPGFTYDPDMIISISSSIPLLWSLIEELSQPVMKKSQTTQKLVVDKKPDGARSPNLADSFIMCYFPVKEKRKPRVGLGGLVPIG